MSNFILLCLGLLAGGAFSLVGAFVISVMPDTKIKNFIKLSTPFAAGALLSAVFFDLFHEGIEIAGEKVLTAALVGIVAFFILERVTKWFHHHHEEDRTIRKSSLLIITSDTVHNALDGVAIASAFLVSPETGIVTALAVAAHEIPQEVGDFGVLVQRGYSKTKALLINVASSLSTLFLGVVVYVLGSEEVIPTGLLYGLSAGFMLYVALSDLIPSVHRSKTRKGIFDVEVAMLLLGIASVRILIELSHQVAH